MRDLPGRECRTPSGDVGGGEQGLENQGLGREEEGGDPGSWQPGGWARVTGSPPQCGTLPEVGPNENLTERSLQDAQRLFLMSEAVQPVTPEPCVTQDSVRFSHLVVDLVQAKDTLYHVLYIGTGEAAPPRRCSGWEGVEGWVTGLRGSGATLRFKATLIWSLQSRAPS